ncbi:hypothetical protein GF374_01175 [Candidatus Woesearchaeota archaeon]|nr:hypothetical protein [Candidatus Woesearchaeota archaeon]
MVAEYVFIVTALVGAIFANITDFKNKWIPDYLNYSLIFIGLGGHAILSVLKTSVFPFAYSIGGAIFFYLIASAMFYTGAWGGGDAKLFVGLGALLPLFPSVLSNISAPWPFLITLFMNILLIGGALGIVVISALAIKHRKKVFPEIYKDLKKYWKIIILVICILLALIIISMLYFETIIALLLLIILFLFPVFLISKPVEKKCLHKDMAPSKLVEGDWVIETIKDNGQIIYKPKKSGIEQKDINKLIELEKAGKLKHVKVKDGIQYAPAILIGLITSLFIGDLLYLLIRGAI